MNIFFIRLLAPDQDQFETLSDLRQRAFIAFCNEPYRNGKTQLSLAIEAMNQVQPVRGRRRAKKFLANKRKDREKAFRLVEEGRIII